MSPDSFVTIGLFLLGGIFTVLWFLLRAKDAKQERDIALLWEKHDEDAKALQDLRIQIAGRHYERTELDGKFEKLEVAFKRGFDVLGDKFDALKDALLQNHNDRNR